MAYFGEIHTVSDILVQVPEEKLLVVGDLFFNNWLPVFSEWIHPDRHRWGLIRDMLRGEEDAIATVVPGHGPLMDRGQLEKQFEYRLRLWDSISTALDSGRNLIEIRRELDLARMAPEMVPWNISDSRGRSVHASNIEAVCRLLTGQR